MLIIVNIVLLLVVGALVSYLALLSALALLASGQQVPAALRSRRFAVVIPAHNEQDSIAKTLKSISNVDYPKSLFTTVVIADNCEDKTASIAKEEGATVYERANNYERGKGYALRWGFDMLLSQSPGYDAIVVVDADSIVSPNFLDVMNYYLDRGARAIQSSDQVESQSGVWSAETTRLGFTLYNYVRPLGRRVMNFSAGLRGNGMCFTTETLRKHPWNAFSLNEDLEYGLNLLVNGITVMFAPEARVLATMPANAANAETQRARWEKGRFPVIKKYAFKLLWSAFTNVSLKPLDALIDLITPPFVNLMGVAFMLCSANVILWIFNIGGVGWLCAGWLLILAMGVFHVLAGLRSAFMDNKGLYRALLYVPRYAFWKLMLYGKLLRRGKTKEWVRTAREHPVKNSS